MSATETTTPAGTTLPESGTWAIEPSHSSVEVVAKHLMMTKVRGLFAEFEGTVTVADDVTSSSVDVTIQAASIDTRNDDRDGHLRSGDFLDTETHPTITFRSSEVVPVEGDVYDIPGELTIRGVTKPVTLRAVYQGLTQDPWGNTRALLSATTEVDREAWDITWNQALETGGVLVSKKLKVEIELQLVKA
jgi:polyisoprenoid-binding protein YceI